MNEENPEYLRSRELVCRENSQLLIVDVQEKLLPHIPVRDLIVENCGRLIQGAQLLDVPVFATEQYPKGLGSTDKAIAESLGAVPEKVRFSCAEVLNWPGAAERSDDRHQVVVAGIEAHVCVLQTVLDLLGLGYQVFVVADSVASRSKFDWQVALDRMSSSGAVVTTTESVLFEWCEVAGTEEFKSISRLVKGR